MLNGRRWAWGRVSWEPSVPLLAGSSLAGAPLPFPPLVASPEGPPERLAPRSAAGWAAATFESAGVRVSWFFWFRFASSFCCWRASQAKAKNAQSMILVGCFMHVLKDFCFCSTELQPVPFARSKIRGGGGEYLGSCPQHALDLHVGFVLGWPCLVGLRASLWLTLKMYCRYCLVALSIPLPEMPCIQEGTSDPPMPALQGVCYCTWKQGLPAEKVTTDHAMHGAKRKRLYL